MLDFFNLLIPVLGSAVRLSIPLLFACFAGLFSELSGVVDIGLEGKMLGAAFAARGDRAIIPARPGQDCSPGIARGDRARRWRTGLPSITHRGNQVVSGLAVNFLASGLTALLGQAWYNEGGRTPQLPDSARFLEITLPGADGLPAPAGACRRQLSTPRSSPVTAYWSIAAFRDGAADVVDPLPHPVRPSPPRRRRKPACGRYGRYFGRASCAISPSSSPVRPMRLRRGLSGHRAVRRVRARHDGRQGLHRAWRRWCSRNGGRSRRWLTCLLFGFLDAAGSRLQGTPLPYIGQVPVEVFQALPYALTVILLAGFIGKAIPPKCCGRALYTKDR